MSRCYSCLKLVDVIVDEESNFCENCANARKMSNLEFFTILLIAAIVAITVFAVYTFFE